MLVELFKLVLWFLIIKLKVCECLELLVLLKAMYFSLRVCYIKSNLFSSLIEYLVKAVNIINPDYSKPFDKVFENICVDKLEKNRL